MVRARSGSVDVLRVGARGLLALLAACSTGGPASPMGTGTGLHVTSASAEKAEGGATTSAVLPDEVPGQGLPPPVASLLQDRCVSCHSSDPTRAPMSLETYDDLMVPAVSDPSQRVADLCLVRMQDPSAPMPPAGHVGATPAETASFAAWLAAGAPSTGEANDGGEGSEDVQDGVAPPEGDAQSDPDAQDAGIGGDPSGGNAADAAADAAVP